MFLKKKLIAGLFLLSIFNLNAASKAKSAILFIGDGMGPAQMLAGRLYKGGSFYKMNFEKFKYTGFSKTHSSDNYTTDSAAGATALAAGAKSYNGSISMSDPLWEKDHKSHPLQTIADLAKNAGKSVGIVTTTRITHATPACYYAHVLQRDSEGEIANQVLTSKVDLWMGGGREFFKPKKSGGKREDGRNILKLMKAKGAYVVNSISDVSKIKKLDHPVLGLFAESHIEYKQTGKSEAMLDDMVKEAIRLLSQNPKGYFLMVEGGRIDHAAHINEKEKMMAEMVDLDDAIGYAMKTVNLKNTLIVLTADHETAGVAINGYGPHESAQGKNLLGKTTGRKTKAYSHTELKRPILTWSTGPKEAHYKMHSAAHSAVDVPIAASGTNAREFTGWMDNTEIPLRMAAAMGLKFTSSVNQNSRDHLQKIQREHRPND